MRLLFDQNLSPRLAARLSDIFPGSLHVQDAGLGDADDEHIWRYAAKHDLAIVTKDVDFNHLSVVRGAPPKVVWLQLGNCTTAEVEAALRGRVAEVNAFGALPEVGTLVMS